MPLAVEPFHDYYIYADVATFRCREDKENSA